MAPVGEPGLILATLRRCGNMAAAGATTLTLTRPGRIRSAPLTSAELPLLTIGLLPVAVLALGHLLFDVVGLPFARHAMELVSRFGGKVPADLAIETGKVWAATAFLYLVVGCGALGFLVHLLRSRVRGQAAIPFLGLAVLLVAIGVAHLLRVDSQRQPLSAIFYLTFDSLGRTGLLESARLAGVRRILDVINLMSVAVPAVFCAFLPASLLRPPQGWTGDVLAGRIKDGRQFGVIASAFLVAGVLHMYAWLQWSTVLLMRKELAPLATSITFYWSCVFTTMIAALYIPLLVILHARAEMLMDRMEVPVAARRQWLTDHGLSYSAISQLPQLAAIFAPLLSTPFSQLLRIVPLEALTG